SKRSSRTTTTPIGEVKFENTGPTVELNGSEPATRGNAAGSSRGRKTSRKKTPAAEKKGKTDGRASRKGAARGPRAAKKQPATTPRAASDEQAAARNLGRRVRELEKETRTVFQGLEEARRQTEAVCARAADLSRQFEESVRQWQDAR